jgi:hypothetical protein
LGPDFTPLIDTMVIGTCKRQLTVYFPLEMRMNADDMGHARAHSTAVFKLESTWIRLLPRIWQCVGGLNDPRVGAIFSLK